MPGSETFTCTIETLAYGGDGIARVNGRVVFIPETVPGETVRARMTQEKRTFARAMPSEILEASPDRIAPCCRVPDADGGGAVRVPGCVYDHLSYAAELRAKQTQLEGFLRHLPNPEPPEFLAPVASPRQLHYRNKIVLHAVRTRDGTRLGYRIEPSHRVLDIRACPLACEPINRSLSALRDSPILRALPHGANVTFRHTASDGAVWWTDAPRQAVPEPEYLTEESPVGPLLVPRDGFYQVNPEAGDALVRTAASWFAASSPGCDILDLYCGVGVFGFACLAAGGARLIGVESGRNAVAAARHNASALGMPAAFHCRALGSATFDPRRWIADPSRTVVIVDPPRDGMSPDVCLALASCGAARILCVSCDPATLARDLSRLLHGGAYRLRRAQLFDLFPRTAHFETLVELARVTH